MKVLSHLLLVCLPLILSCKHNNTQLPVNRPLFSLVPSAESGLYFINELKETEAINILTYEYLYNGGGVAIGDINNDGLPDVFMVGNLFGGRLFLNKGNLQFEQISEKANVFYPGFSTGVTMVDINEDGWLDIYICRSLDSNPEKRANLLLINNHNNTFTESAKQYGLDDRGYSNHANFFDYDNDGDLDMFLLNHRSDFEAALTLRTYSNSNKLVIPEHDPFISDKLYRNNGSGTFTDVTHAAGIANHAFGLSATITDINNDGWADIYVASDYADKDFFYINKGNGTFTDAANDMLPHFCANAMGTDIADINNDGLFDLVTVDMLAEDHYRQKQLKGSNPYDKVLMAAELGLGYQIMHNSLQLNNGNGTFSEIGQLAGISHTDWSWAPLIADFDNDGWKDLFISTGYARDVTDLDYMKYESATWIKNSGGLDNVKRMDLLKLMNSTPLVNYMYRNNGDLTFTNKIREWGLNHPSFSNGAAYADLDGDGDLDLLTNNYNSEAFLFRNNARELTGNHYLRVKLEGTAQNPHGAGAKVTVKTDGLEQVQAATINRGFLSAVEPVLHFGMGKARQADEVYIDWPNGKTQILNNVNTDQVLVLKITDAKDNRRKKGVSKKIMEDCTVETGIRYRHTDNYYIDFKREPLLEHMYSNKGPCLAKGDINGDGLEDIYIGGAAGQPGVTIVQTKQGKFQQWVSPVFTTDKMYEDAGACLFDADNDGDNDLYVASGGYQFEWQNALYSDRLYLNDGKGNFTRDTTLPELLSNSTCVAGHDFDMDGDMDLFIGGGVRPGNFPFPSKSYLLQNNRGHFTDVSSRLPAQGFLGIVNDALWCYVNGDKNPDLVIAGEWMPLTLLVNNNNIFENVTARSGLEKSSGAWNCIKSGDFDGDGDTDFIAGNRGENSFFKASVNQPATLFAADFDHNGSIEAIPCYYYNNGVCYPQPSLDDLVSQASLVRKKMYRYDLYSKATMKDIFDSRDIAAAQKLHIYTFSTSLIKNNGNGTYEIIPLPVEAQFAPVQDIAILDVNKDSLPDIILCGNDYGANVEFGRQDASIGLLLLNAGKGKFTPLRYNKSGLNIKGDARRIVTVSTGNGKKYILTAVNNGECQVFSLIK